MRQKSNHLLDFLADRDAAANNPLAALLAASGASLAVQRAASQQPINDEEDAAGESDDAMGEEDESGQPRKGKSAGIEDPNGRATPDVNASQRRATSVGSMSGDRRVNGKPNGEASVSDGVPPCLCRALIAAAALSAQSPGQPGAHVGPGPDALLHDPL